MTSDAAFGGLTLSPSFRPTAGDMSCHDIYWQPASRGAGDSKANLKKGFFGPGYFRYTSSGPQGPRPFQLPRWVDQPIGQPHASIGRRDYS